MQGRLRAPFSLVCLNVPKEIVMSLSLRLRAGASAALKHLAVSVLVALMVGALVFGVWYPSPYDELAGGQDLFWLVIVVDVVCGPLLTLVIFNPKKPRNELARDIGLVVLIQLAALIYGLNSVAQARPVWLAFEGSRFRVVSVPDLADQNLGEAPESLRSLSWTGPKLLGVKLAQPTDQDYQQSVLRSLDGLHPAFRPSRWQSYESQVPDLLQVLQPVDRLLTKQPSKAGMVRAALKDWEPEALGFLPLVSGDVSDWVVIVRRDTGQPISYLAVDGY